MRDGTREIGARRRPDALIRSAPGVSAADVRPVADHPGHPQRPAHAKPDTSERIFLIEFVWSGLTGTQPVILVSREWLH